MARARAKRANSAGEAAGARRKEGRPAAVDPVLPEKKRARRRLVGAVALALAVAVGLPMLLDSEPKPLAGDIAIQIPSKDKPLSDIAPGAASTASSASAAPASSAAVTAADTLDKREEFIAPPAKVAAPAPTPAVAAAPAPVKVEAKSPPKPDAKAELKAAESKHADKADVKTVDVKHADKVADKAAEKVVAKAAKSDDKPAAKSDDKPAAKAADAPPDAARALAILEGKAPADDAAPAASKFVVQVAALGSSDKVAELQARLKEAGIRSYTEKGAGPSGDHVVRVRVGPLNKDEADKLRAKLGKLGLSGSSTVPF